MKSRDMLRIEAKKIYKEQVKARGVPKKQRIPFSQFFKQYVEIYKKQHAAQKEQAAPVVSGDEDFNFEDMVSMNEISDEDVEISEGEEE